MGSEFWTAALAGGIVAIAGLVVGYRMGIRAADRRGPWCDQCGGPFPDKWLKQYGRHWDTCPNATR
jgi:hypothetical protein